MDTPIESTVKDRELAAQQSRQKAEPDKGNWNYAYNAFGELVEQTDAKGQLTTMSYDEQGRRRTRQVYWADGSLAVADSWLLCNTSSSLMALATDFLAPADGDAP